MGKGTTALGIVLKIALVGVVVACACLLVPKLLEYKESDDAYKKLKDEVIEPENPTEPSKENASESVLDEETESETEEEEVFKVDWEKLKGTDVVAWLQIDEISYPVMHSDNNQKYLHALPDGTYNYGGSIFLYSKNKPLFEDKASFLYGHNMANGSMFGKLKRYTDKKYANHRFYVYLPDGTRRVYEFFGVLSTHEGSGFYVWSFGTDEEFMNWQKSVKNASFYKTGGEPSLDGKYVLLSTCNGPAGTSQRLLVIGKYMGSEEIQEPASWYDEYRDRILDEEIAEETTSEMMEEFETEPVEWQ